MSFCRLLSKSFPKTILLFCQQYYIIPFIGNENKQMWFATLHIKACPLDWRWCYDRRSIDRNNTFIIIRNYFRNYYSICLNYRDYNFEQIENKKHICNLLVRCVFYTKTGKPRLWFLHFLFIL